MRSFRLRRCTRKTILTLGIVAIVASAVATLNYRHHPHRLGASAIYRSADRSAPYALGFVEIDDQGWLWAPSQARTVFELIKRTAAQSNTFLVVYVHGWHHDASCCDLNVECFKALLANLSRQLAHEAGASGQPFAADDRRSAYRVVGVYVGWRGRSLPGWLDYLTFWGRKAAAERIGEGDLQEFLLRLDRLHDEHRAGELGHTSLGLVVIGHSFGAQALFRALGPRLEAELIRTSAGPGYLRVSGPSAPTRLDTALDGVGDFVVLVNPAVRAAEYERMRRLARQLRYSARQSPVLLVVAAENDHVSRWWFPLGQIAARWGRLGATLQPDQVALETSALGVYAAQQTHRLELAKRVDEQKRLSRAPPANTSIDAAGSCGCPWISRESAANDQGFEHALGPELRDDVARLRVFDFSSELTAGGVRLAPLDGAAQRIEHLPYLVIRADPRLIDGHNGIFTSTFADFVVPYMVFIERKKHIWHGDLQTPGAREKEVP